jgi:RNA polymerase sigma-70 factor (ECF subfamily)
MSLDTEALLITRCRRGDTDAWNEVFDAHYSATGRFVFQLAPDFTREDVEEVCQETFLAVINSIKTFEGHSHLQTWIFRIAANKARDYRQRQNAAKRGGGIAPISLQQENTESGLTIDPPSPALSPDDLLMTEERVAQVAQALEGLGGPCQEIIELRYFADLSYEEISGALKLNPKTVSSRLSKCLDRLEQVMRVVICGGKTKPFSV